MITFTLSGQLPSGKNAVMVTRTGQRFPAPRFRRWREGALQDVLRQKRAHQRHGKYFPLTCPIKLVVNYTPGDRRIRDISGMTDAILHLLEKAALVENDGQVYELVWRRNLPGSPEAVFALLPWDGTKS